MSIDDYLVVMLSALAAQWPVLLLLIWASRRGFRLRTAHPQVARAALKGILVLFLAELARSASVPLPLFLRDVHGTPPLEIGKYLAVVYFVTKIVQVAGLYLLVRAFLAERQPGA